MLNQVIRNFGDFPSIRNQPGRTPKFERVEDIGFRIIKEVCCDSFAIVPFNPGPIPLQRIIKSGVAHCLLDFRIFR